MLKNYLLLGMLAMPHLDAAKRSAIDLLTVQGMIAKPDAITFRLYTEQFQLPFATRCLIDNMVTNEIEDVVDSLSFWGTPDVVFARYKTMMDTFRSSPYEPFSYGLLILSFVKAQDKLEELSAMEHLIQEIRHRPEKSGR